MIIFSVAPTIESFRPVNVGAVCLPRSARAETEEFDGTGKPYNPGGTYHFLNLAHGKGLEDGKDIHIIRDELPCAARKNSGRK